MNPFPVAACLSTLLILATTATALGQSRLPSPPQQIPNSQPAIADSTWQITDRARLRSGTRYTHEFRGEANQTITITASSRQFNTHLEVYDLKGRLIAHNVGADPLGNSRIQVTLPRTGSYTLVVRGAGRRARGNFTLSIQADRGLVPQQPRSQQGTRLWSGEEL